MEPGLKPQLSFTRPFVAGTGGPPQPWGTPMDNRVREVVIRQGTKPPKPGAGAWNFGLPVVGQNQPPVCQWRTRRPRAGQGQREGGQGGRCQPPLYRRETESGRGALLAPAPFPCGTHLGVESLWFACLGLVVRGHGGLSGARMTWKTRGSCSEDPSGPRLSHPGSWGPTAAGSAPLGSGCPGAEGSAGSRPSLRPWFTSLHPHQLQREK